MPIQLTPEQEQRLQAVVNAGAYGSAEEALEVALTVVEKAAARTFDGTQDELEGLLMEGLGSNELSEEDFWHSVDSQTNTMLASYNGRGCSTPQVRIERQIRIQLHAKRIQNHRHLSILSGDKH